MDHRTHSYYPALLRSVLHRIRRGAPVSHAINETMESPRWRRLAAIGCVDSLVEDLAAIGHNTEE